MSSYIIYTDGAYSSSKDQGGIGIVFTKNGEVVMQFSKMYQHTSNNQMEIRAIILALKSIKKPVDSITIVTDSQYAIGVMTKGWKRKKNIELLKVYDQIYAKVSKLCPKIEFQWVKGHQDNEFNKLADFLAFNASQSIS